ncbi:MAG: YceI family protein [Burkholderiales bacterium]|nr:YceI family protein [Burkholderiales bacterium]
MNHTLARTTLSFLPRPRRRAASVLLLAAVLAPVAALAQTPAPAPPPARLQAQGSEIAFVIKQMGVPVEGRFGRFDAQIALDPRRPETGRVSMSIDTGSARFGAAEIDVEVGKPVWLSTAKFPQASFQSSAIKALGGGRFEVSGQLSIKGSTQPLVVPVQITQSGASSTASGSFAIKRLAFKVGDGEWADTSLVADEVQVRFKLALTGLPPL